MPSIVITSIICATILIIVASILFSLRQYFLSKSAAESLQKQLAEVHLEISDIKNTTNNLENKIRLQDEALRSY